MRWGFPSAVKAGCPANILIYAFSGGLLGYYFQLHQVFLEGSNSHIPARTVKGFLVGGLLGFLLFLLIGIIPIPAVQRVVKKCVAVLSQVAIFAALAYLSYVLFKNTLSLFSFDSPLPDILRIYPVYAAASLLGALISRFTIRWSFATSSIVIFLLFCSYILIKTGSVIGFTITMAYHLYLILMGRFSAGVVARLLRLEFNSALDTLLVSFVTGILCNYVVWYVLGQLSLLYSATVYCVAFLVLSTGLFRYGRSIYGGAKVTLAAADALFNKKTDHVAAVLLNVTLFCFLLLVAVLAVKFPGSGDSSARMYCATVFKFAEMHGIVFPPFFQHWPLLFQPLLLEISGLPPYLAGGITALRFFHGTVYFSFIPFVILLCKKYDLPFRALVVFVLIVVSSSFSLCLAYFDKPSAVANPAFISLLVVCLVMLKDPKPWYIVAGGVLMAIIYNSKLVLFLGAVASLLLLCAFLALKQPENRSRKWRKAVAVSAGIFFFACSLNFIQNIYLRGNPIHPFAAGIFKSSNNYPEEVKFSQIPSDFYKKTMPIIKPSQISTINLDRSKGMYRPLLPDSLKPKGRSYFLTQTSVNIAVILTAVLLPFLLIIRHDKILVFCSIMAFVSFFVWFGWVGDGLRYSTFFPCIALLGALLSSRPLLANRFFDHAWRSLFYGLLIFSVPIGLYFTSNLPTTEHMAKFLLNRVRAQESFEPEVQMVTAHLREQSDAKPVLLVADSTIGQYGLFQPNFLYQPLHWRKELFTNMVYLSVIKPTHFLTTGKLDQSILMEHYPFLADHLVLEKVIHLPKKHFELYRFDNGTPWERYNEEFRQKETVVPGHIQGIQKILGKYRSQVPAFIAAPGSSTPRNIPGVRTSNPALRE